MPTAFPSEPTEVAEAHDTSAIDAPITVLVGQAVQRNSIEICHTLVVDCPVKKLALVWIMASIVFNFEHVIYKRQFLKNFLL